MPPAPPIPPLPPGPAAPIPLAAGAAPVPEPDEYLIIGPSRSGKTSLIGVLEMAADKAAKEFHHRFKVNADGQEMHELFRSAAEISSRGKFGIDPSNDVTTYRFLLSVKTHPSPPRPDGFAPPVLPKSLTKQYRFSMMDGPGEALFGGRGADLEEARKTRQTLVDLGRKSTGLVICMNGFDEETTAEFFPNLLPILYDMATNFVLPFKRVAVVLTHADRMFAPKRGDARDAACSDPWDRVEHLLGGEIGMNQLLKLLPDPVRPAVYAGWSSVYGFTTSGGFANYYDGDGDKEKEGLRERTPEGRAVMREWSPFRILDPFVYVATEEWLGLHQLPKAWHVT